MATRTKIFSWNPDRGFGFCMVGEERVFVHVTVVSPRPARGANLNGQEVMVGEVDRKAAKGPRATSVLTVEEYERREKEAKEAREKAAYWASLETSMDPPGFVREDGQVVPIRKAQKDGCSRELAEELIGRHREFIIQKYGLREYQIGGLFNYDSHTWDQHRLNEFLGNRTLKEAFDRLYEAMPISFGWSHSTEWDRAIKAVIPAEDALVVLESASWDNDAKEVSTRAGARSLEFFSDSWEYILHRSVPKGGKVFVSLAAYVTQGEQIGETERWSDLSADRSRSTYAAISSDQPIESTYHVSEEGAEIIWQYCQWYLLEKYELEQVRYQAQEILKARELWEQEFPGVEPGDRAGAIESLKIFGLYPHTTNVGDWVTKVFWYVPSFLLQPEEEMWAERARRLQELVAEGNERAQELLAREAADRFWEELIESFQEVTGLGWDWDEMWSDSIETDEDTVPVWAAFVGDGEVACPGVWYTRSGGRPYYRIFENDIHVPAGYTPSAIRWEKIGEEPARRY